ncbi:MAG: transposase [Nitrococcus sp.]|nr:transposase [Nitrococcus sp.]
MREEFDCYAAGRKLRLEEHKAARSIMACRTLALGRFEYRCPEGHEAWQGYHSCHHRSCPQCNGQAKEEWLRRTRSRLLPVDHFHVVMTLPHELNALWQHNRVWFSRQLFANASASLMELLADPRHLGAVPGLLLAEHTWGRSLAFHPHVHCLVTAGGVDPAGRWCACRGNFLVPGRALGALYRGKWLAALYKALDTSQLRLPSQCTEQQVRQLLRGLAKKPWHVRIQCRYRHGRGVVGYLARYVRGGPIRNRSLTVLPGGKVRFIHYDHKRHHYRTLTLAKHRFLARLLSHVPPTYRQRIRYYGVYHPHRSEQRQQLRRQLNAPSPLAPKAASELPCCSQCRQPYRVRHWSWRESYSREGTGARHVQLNVEANVPRGSEWRNTTTGPPCNSIFLSTGTSLN